MVHELSMIKLNIHEAKTHLSKHLARLKQGEIIVLCEHNMPIAKIRPLPTARTKPRPFGLAQGTVRIASGFSDPLPDELLDFFEGKGG